MYSPRSLRLFGRGQAHLRPRQPAQPRRAGRPAPARRRPAARPPGCASRGATLRLAHDGGSRRATPCTAAPASASASPKHRHRRRDVPVLPRHPRREGLHPRPGPGAPGGGQRHAGHRRAGDSDEVHEALDLCLSCKGCASRLPHRRRHGDLQGRGAAPALPPAASGRAATTRWAGCRAGPGWPRRVAPLANAAAAASARSQRLAKAAAGIDQRRSRAGVRAPAAAALGPRDVVRARRRPASTSRRRGLGGLVHRPLRPRDRPRRGPACSRRPACAVGVVAERACCGLTWVTTGQLDAARRIIGAHASTTLHPYVAAGRPGRRPGAVLPGDAALGRRRADRRPAGRRGRGRGAHPGRGADRRARAGRRPT